MFDCIQTGLSGRGCNDLGQVQGQDKDQGQDLLLLQRAALPLYLVLALTLVLVLTLDLAQITKQPLLNYLCSRKTVTKRISSKRNLKQIDDMNLHKNMRRIQLE